MTKEPSPGTDTCAEPSIGLAKGKKWEVTSLGPSIGDANTSTGIYVATEDIANPLLSGPAATDE